MNGVGVELAQGFFGLVDLLGGIGDVVCPDGFGSVLDEGLAGIESMPIAELPGDSGFALLGESLFPDAEKVTKNALPLHPAPRSARGSFAPSPLQGSAYKGLPWPFKPFAASMRLTSLRNDSALPTEGARLGPATIFNRRMMTISRPVSFVGNVLYGFPSYWILAITDLQATSIAPFRRPNVVAT
ncbi:hypothetical protein BFM99_19825 [Stutzerimonas stutzeri]|nr:hypothetical protein BFM99_19825 [Stutzerimonas stutzeri]